MPAKQVLTLAQLLALLQAGPSSPSALAQAAGTSLATVNRKLKEAHLANDVVKVGRGPAMQYRLATAADRQDRLSRAHQVVLELGVPEAALVQRALELYARIGMGQMDFIADEFGYNQLKRTDGSLNSPANMEQARATLDQLRFELTGMAPCTSYGIYGDRTSDAVKKAWGMQHAVRHRMAWDRQPLGGGSTQFDEPCTQDPNPPQLTVRSGAASLDVTELLARLPSGTFVGKDGSDYLVVGLDKAKASLIRYARSADLQTAITMAENVAKGVLPRNFTA
jgi:hypothetical protein